MIGGVVIETMVLKYRVWILCQERLKNGTMLSDKCSIFVENTPKSRSVSEGDIIWWQGAHAMWTAKDSNGRTVGKPDTKLARIGFSGVNRPDKEMA